MASNLSVSFDYTEIKKALETFGADKLKIQRKCINRVLVEIKKEIRRRLTGGVINQRVGNLYESLYFTTKKVKDTAGESELLSIVGFPNKKSRRSGRATYYGKFYESDTDIIVSPRGKGPLTWVNDAGEFRKSKGFTMKRRPLLMKPVLNTWMDGGRAAAIMEREILQANLNKVFEATK
jgi:hypothetical protein